MLFCHLWFCNNGRRNEALFYLISIFQAFPIKVDMSWICMRSCMTWAAAKHHLTLSTQDVSDKAQIWIYRFIHFKAEIRGRVQRGNTHFSGFPKWTCNLHLIFPTNSWELRHIRWHGTTSHPQPCGSCDNGPPTSKSSLDQTTASCTVAKKQSPKYVYPRRRALMLIKMNDSNQLMWTCTYRTGEKNIKMESSTEPRLHKPELCRGN